MQIFSILNTITRPVIFIQNGFRIILLQTQSWLNEAGTIGFDPFEEATSGVLDIFEHLAGLLKMIIGIAALLILARLVVMLMSGDKDSAKKLLWWIVGLAAGFALLEVLCNLDYSVSYF